VLTDEEFCCGLVGRGVGRVFCGVKDWRGGLYGLRVSARDCGRLYRVIQARVGVGSTSWWDV